MVSYLEKEAFIFLCAIQINFKTFKCIQRPSLNATFQMNDFSYLVKNFQVSIIFSNKIE